MKKIILSLFSGVLWLSVSSQVNDIFTPLPPESIRLTSYFENDIQNSIEHWNLGVVPYSGFVDIFRKGRAYFAQGEMWGKAVRSGCMFYRYHKNPQLKARLRETVYDLISTKRNNGSISASEVSKQPEGKLGDLWERKYVLLGLEEYYENVEQDPKVLSTLIEQVDLLISQIGRPPKVPVNAEGWSPNHIESSTILEPVMRLYRLTGHKRFLDFAKYIISEGGAKGYNIIEQAYKNVLPYKMGGPYPKAYEMMSLFEGIADYYRATGDQYSRQAMINLFNNIKSNEITIIGNGGGDQPYHPAVYGEAWDNTALEQTNPKMQRMMETCVGVTWLKFCSHILRLSGDPSAVDYIEKYVYNGLIGAMKPEGDGFSYVNLLNGIKTNTVGWGGKVNGVSITCCNLNGPMGLAYIPYVAVMGSAKGPVINLYNAADVHYRTPKGKDLDVKIISGFPRSGKVEICVDPVENENFTIKLRIPEWSKNTTLLVNGKKHSVVPGTYKDISRIWSSGDKIELLLDMRCRIIDAPKGSYEGSENFQAVIRGPMVLARDENLEKDFDQPVRIISKNGFVNITSEKSPVYRMKFKVPVLGGFISMVDYSSINNWNGKRVCTWLPTK